MKYGTTTAYGQQTKMLGPPEASFTTLLTNLNPNQTYHYKVIAEDNAGNVSESNDQTFTTTNNGVYIFTPAADTYIERNSDAGTYSHLYGPTRAFGNYGWMNLMSANGRYCYLKFQIPNSLNNIAPQTLRLYCREGGQSGINLYQFNPVSPNWESAVTWADQSSVGGQSGDGFQDSNGGIIGALLGSTASPMNGNQWYSFNFASPASVVSVVEGNFIVYYFALQGAGNSTAKLSQDVSFDSHESTNNQPELIIQTGQPAFTEMPISLPGVEDGDAAWGDYDRDEDLDIAITGLGANGALAKIFRNDNNGNFVDINASLTPVSFSALDWGDYDMDNDLDLVLAGVSSSGGLITKIYRNNNGTFVELATSLTGVKYCDVAWGNYNNDQYLDIILSGQNSSYPSFFTKIYQGGSNGVTRNWTEASVALPLLKYSSVAWGDNDLDGYLDLLLAGTDDTNSALIKVFRNKKNTDGTRGFIAVANNPPQDMTASCAWGNFDTDSDLDIAFAGRQNSNTSVYKRLVSGTGYDPVDDASLTDVKQGTVAWGDYDNDGDLDLLVTGQLPNDAARISKVYRNEPGPNGRTFVDIAAPLTGVWYGSAAWGDYDNDGDLDILLTGNMNASGAAGRITKIYRNNLNVTNTVPSAPANLHFECSETDETITLRWDESTDQQTPQDVLTYNVMIGTTSGGFDIVSPISKTSTGKRWIPATGNASTNNFYIISTKSGDGLLPSTDYYWRVQAIDNVFGASNFSNLTTTFEFPCLPKSAARDSVAKRDSLAQTIPQTFALSQNYPNPFNPTTRLDLNLPENGRVKAIVYDLTGQEVARLQDAAMTAGYKYLTWDGKNETGATVSSGTYLVKVIFEGVSGVRKEATSRVALLK